MANKRHLKRLMQGAETWNAWRRKRPRNYPIDLSGAELFRVELDNVDLSRANLANSKIEYSFLRGANFSDANLDGASLDNSHLSNALLEGAVLDNADLHAVRFNNATLIDASLIKVELGDADLSGADLTRANLTEASLQGTNLNGAKIVEADLAMTRFYLTDLAGTIFNGAELFETEFVNVDLSAAIGLDACDHRTSSVVDHRTLLRSGPLPLPFLRGVGMPDILIEYLPSLINKPIRLYSCFISYSVGDADFADRFHADLQNKGVRCWFAPHDMPIGGKILDEIDSGIMMRDKVLIILSEQSIKSEWVEDEVTKAFEEERKRGQIVLFPIRLDDAVMNTTEPWAAKLRGRHIGDFRKWKSHDAYKKSLDRLLRDLKVEKT